jgi:hypothetical protein
MRNSHTRRSGNAFGGCCFKTGISSLIGQTEGTLFVEVNVQEVIWRAGANANWHFNGTTSRII